MFVPNIPAETVTSSEESQGWYKDNVCIGKLEMEMMELMSIGCMLWIAS